MTEYDYIIIGAGAAGLMLATAMAKDPYFAKSTVLLLDKSTKNTDDRTWCFWEQGKGNFDHILYKSWKHIYFAGQGFEQRTGLDPYTYKMVRGIDFYEDSLMQLNASEVVRFEQAEVLKIRHEDKGVSVKTSNGEYYSRFVFNSMLDYQFVRHQKQYPLLLQHFQGWVIKSEQACFDPGTVTFMDFSVPQMGNTRFMYVLPFTETSALVEYTLFSGEVLPDSAYEEAISDYLNDKLQGGTYEILKKEKGAIPMSCYDFASQDRKHLLHIGTAGGWAKPSTGYAFMSTSRKIKKLIVHLKQERPLVSFFSRNRFWYYDLLLLDILDRNNALGHLIFTSLFKRRRAQRIFKFLDEETTLWEDLKMIWACSPKNAFLQALIRRLF